MTRPLTMQEYNAAKKKILAAAKDPRGTTITAFTVRETAAFTGFAISTVGLYLAAQKASSLKMPAFNRKLARVVPMDAFLKLTRKQGKHKVLGLHASKQHEKMQTTLNKLRNAIPVK